MRRFKDNRYVWKVYNESQAKRGIHNLLNL